MKEKTNKLGREKRGKVSEEEVRQYEKDSLEELSLFLDSGDSKQRTIAATLIGNRKILKMIPKLCDCLVKEKSLYSRIAISEALGKMGEPAVIPLISILGKIGNNQEIKLPEKCFEKKSFPLVRDIAARTLVKIGKPSIRYLIDKIKSGDSFETQQAIDAIGGIASKTNDKEALSVLLQMLERTNDEVTTWKVIRTLSAFKDSEVIEPLIKNINNSNPSIRWEATRSIGQIGISNSVVIDTLRDALKDESNEVRKAAQISLQLIEDELMIILMKKNI